MLTNTNENSFRSGLINFNNHLNGRVRETDFHFKVKRVSFGICLGWSTGAESNMDRFDILHSRDGVHFSKLTHVWARGNSNFPSNYEWIHTSPAQGSNYYRLQQFYRDEEFTFSNVIPLSLDGL